MTNDMNTENNNEYKTPDNKPSWTDGSSNTLKFLAMCLSAFLGGFLAIFALGGVLSLGHKNLHKIQHQKHYTQEQYKADRIFDEEFKKMQSQLDKEFELYSPRPPMPITMPKALQKVVQLEENPNNYKVYIDLKKFDNNEKNVNVTVKTHSIKIDGKTATKDEYHQSSFSYMQDIPLVQKIETSEVKKERIGNMYVITLPFED